MRLIYGKNLFPLFQAVLRILKMEISRLKKFGKKGLILTKSEQQIFTYYKKKWVHLTEIYRSLLFIAYVHRRELNGIPCRAWVVNSIATSDFPLKKKYRAA